MDFRASSNVNLIRETPKEPEKIIEKDETKSNELFALVKKMYTLRQIPEQRPTKPDPTYSTK